MVELGRGWNARWHAGCAGALLVALLCATGRAQTTLAIAGEGSTTPPNAAAASGAPLLSYRRDDPANNPLRPAVIPVGATETAPENPAGHGNATAAFAPGEPPISHDAPATPLVAADPMAGSSVPMAAPFGGSAPLPSTPPAGTPVTTPPPAASVEDYNSGPRSPYDAASRAGPPQPLAGSPPQALSTETEPSAPAAAPTFTLPASANEPIPRSYEATARTTPDAAASRRLAPASDGAAGYRSGGATKSTLMPTAFGQLKSLASAGGALLLVVALFVACALLLRRGGPKPSGVLPAEAFAVLGRAPLTAQSFAQLLRLGNKLVLVAVTADGAQPLAEVDDPTEVDRIAGLCLSGRGGGPSAEFQQVLAQLSREPAKGFLGREGSTARRRA